MRKVVETRGVQVKFWRDRGEKLKEIGLENASTVEGHLRRPEAAIFVHLVDSDGDLVVEG